MKFRTAANMLQRTIKSGRGQLCCLGSGDNGKYSVEELWRQFFSDPSQWWNHTTHKVNPLYPDFKHKKTGMALWINRRSNPSWVKTELTSMIPGSVSRSLFSWNCMIFGCVKSNQHSDVLKLYNQMLTEGVKPDTYTFTMVLNSCASLMALDEGRRVHACVMRNSCESDVYVGSTLVDMYAKCGSIENAQSVFYRMPIRNVVTWNAMLAGYVKCAQGQKALELYLLMQGEGVQPNHVTFVAVLNACARVLALAEGRCVHAQLIQSACESDVFVGNALVDMYAKSGSIEDALRVFHRMPARNVVSWTAMLAGLVKCDEGWKALELFTLMKEEGVKPNPVTFVVVLNACASLMALEEGSHIHGQLIERGCDSFVSVGNTLVDMYAKCGCIKDAERVFHKMSTRNVVSWTAMLTAYVKCEQGQKALELFALMQEDGVIPNSVTFLVILNACASIMALEEGRRIHAQLIESGCEIDLPMGNTLVDMYAKCGSIQDAQRVFYEMPSHDVASWNAMLSGFAMHGQAKEALHLFQDMHQAGVEMDMVTFVCVLSACSHGGLVQDGVHIFESMSSIYGISQTVEHYVCLVDLLGRGGLLYEAENFLLSEPKINQDSIALMTLLSACKNHNEVQMGERIAQQLLELDPDNAVVYVLLSNIYAAAGKWDSCDKVQEIWKERGMKKLPERTQIEVDSTVHSFIVDQVHPQIEEIHAELERLFEKIEEAGYVADTRSVLQAVEEDQKLYHLCHHREKLAIAFGLISTAPGTPLRISKNLRVCVDCHTTTKFITKIVGREIIVRDSNRFHYFRDGACSCRDYW